MVGVHHCPRATASFGALHNRIVKLAGHRCGFRAKHTVLQTPIGDRLGNRGRRTATDQNCKHNGAGEPIHRQLSHKNEWKTCEDHQSGYADFPVDATPGASSPSITSIMADRNVARVTRLGKVVKRSGCPHAPLPFCWHCVMLSPFGGRKAGRPRGGCRGEFGAEGGLPRNVKLCTLPLVSGIRSRLPPRG